jgi:hypothetical protein
VRSSVTESALTFRFEADQWSKLPEMVHAFCDALGDVGDRLWDAYQAATVGDAPCRVGPMSMDGQPKT